MHKRERKPFGQATGVRRFAFFNQKRVSQEIKLSCFSSKEKQHERKIGFHLGDFLMFTFRLWEFIISWRDYVTRHGSDDASEIYEE